MALRHVAPPRPELPSLAVGRRRLKIVAAGFALAFASVGLRLVDMVEWRQRPAGNAAVAQPVETAQPEPRTSSGRKRASGRMSTAGAFGLSARKTPSTNRSHESV
jgi:hypothetical protein